MPEHELRRIFDKFGSVQTCIVNKDKRHAFVKMVSREDAVRAKEAMEKNRTPDSQLRVSVVNKYVSFLSTLSNYNRLGGELASDQEIAAITKPVSVLSQSASSPMPIVNGC
jgi:hypothetical protein